MIEILKSGNKPSYTTTCKECGSELKFNRSDVVFDAIHCKYCRCSVALEDNWVETKKLEEK
jgi:hypothetical protein